MQPQVRFRLQNAVNYHNDLAEHYDRSIDEADEAEGEERDTSEAERMRDMHDDVAKQLQDILDADPAVPGIDVAMANRPVKRNTEPVQRRRRVVMH